MQTIPKFQETFIPLLKVLNDEQSRHILALKKETRDKYYSDLPAELLNKTYNNGSNTLMNRLGWGVTYLNLAGYISKPQRAHYKITDKGLKQCNSGELSLVELKKQQEFIAYETGKKSKSDEEQAGQNDQQETENSTDPYDALDNARKEIENSKKRDIFEEIEKLRTRKQYYAFEKLALKLLKAMGYGDGKTIHTSKSRDGGKDGIIYQDQLGLDKIFVEIKLYAEGNLIREPQIRNFCGAMSGDTNKGIFVTASTFHDEAIQKVKSTNYKIELIDKDKLLELMFEHDIGVQTTEVIKIKEIDSDFFDNLENF